MAVGMLGSTFIYKRQLATNKQSQMPDARYSHIHVSMALALPATCGGDSVHVVVLLL